MNNEQKMLIAHEVAKLAKKTSQNKVAKKAGVSSATISQMINQNWELISDEMWRKVQISLKLNPHWQIADTENLRGVIELLQASQNGALSIGISHDAGAGKSEAYKKYERESDNVILIECKNVWSKKSYLRNLLTACGLSNEGTTEQLFYDFVEHVKTLNKPLVIIDQVDKLKDPSLDLFMDFYNELFGSCGFVLSGVPALKKRVMRGAQRDKIGYRELWSRIGRKFISLDPLQYKDVALICLANGLNDEDKIREIFNTAEGDLRRVRRSVEQYHLLINRKSA